MLKILRKLGKGVWKEDRKAKEVVVKRKRRKTSKKSREELLDELLKSIKNDVRRSGSKRMTVSRLFNRIGVQKRSEKSIALFYERANEHGYYISPDISMSTDWKSTITFKLYPERQLGELFSSERKLEKYIEENGFYKKLGVETVKSQYEPDGTRDRLDFLGQTGDQRVVLELKKKDGGKSAVEQVFRYSGYLKREFPDVRKILITGIQNRETALAIAGQSPEERKGFEWYLYKYDSLTGELDFERVTDKQIEDQLKPQLS